jgi:hypothetical protein
MDYYSRYIHVVVGGWQNEFLSIRMQEFYKLVYVYK